MKTESLIESRWAALMQNASPSVKLLLETLSERHAAEFASTFYAEMMLDPEASSFLAAEGMTVRLRESMTRWLNDILTRWEPSAISGLIAAQRQMGSVHARIGVPIELVMRGTRLLKQTLARSLFGDAVARDHLEAALLAVEIIDMAVEVMAHQYSASNEIEARQDEAYRNYAASVNMSVELERQRAALFGWKTELLQAVVIGMPGDPLPLLAKSPFGLWLRHKAFSIFSTEGGFHEVLKSVESVDRQLELLQERRTANAQPDESRQRVALVLNEAKQIQALVESLFEDLISLETGRDTLTQLLSRRFQSTILTREIELSRNAGKQFAVLLFDIDHFKSVNDRYGHEAGDLVLRRVAEIFTANVRSGDFVFRHGGEEFMILCVELTAKEAVAVANKIRAAVQAERVRISDTTQLSITVSVGVAAFDGHPDYQRLLIRADKALYEAKTAGRNRCALAA